MIMKTDLDSADKSTLEQLNQEYVDAFMNGDVEWYRKHLAEDFVVIESDGSIFNKQEFLTNTARGPDVADYKLQKVDVRIYGNVALVHAIGVWTTANGSKGRSLYTDIYVKEGGEWKTVAAQITRSQTSPALNEEPR